MNAAPPLVWYMTQAYAIVGGHEAHVLHFATELRQQGFETRVRVLDQLPATAHRFMQLLRARKIPLDSVRREHSPAVNALWTILAPFWSLALIATGRKPNLRLLRNFLADRLAARALRRQVRAEQPAIIHILGRLADYAWPELPAARCVLHHGTEGRRDETWDHAEADAFRDFARKAGRNFAPGQGVAENVRREFGITRPIDTVFTLCPDAKDRPAAKSTGQGGAGTGVAPLRFGILCRMTPEKGIQALLEALREYQSRHGAVNFLFAGSGALEPDVRAFIAQHGLRGVRVQPEFESPPEVLRMLDVFVHPSLSDAMPLAIAEALMCGLPCVATRVGGIPDLVRDGQEGILIEPGQPGQIMAAMERFQNMPPAEREAYGRRARARYEAVCRPDRVGAVIAAHYRQLLAEVAAHA